MNYKILLNTNNYFLNYLFITLYYIDNSIIEEF